MPNYRRRTDNTQAEIIAALRADGWRVKVFSMCGQGVHDLAVERGGVKVWVECKSAGGELTAAEEEFRRYAPGPFVTAYSGAEAVRLCAECLAVFDK